MNEADRQGAPAPDPLLGTVVDDRYRVVRLLGRGGMGAVYECHNIRLHDRPCAMKVLAGLGTPRERTRFEREIRTIAQLRSLHTVPVFDSGALPDQRPYVVMELLEGRGLDEALADGERLSLPQTLTVADQVLTALIEAHGLGIVHRDLKPANLFLVREDGSEVAKVLDFGIAKQTGDDEPALTRRNASMGTPQYMAPEQFRNEPADGRTDLYALGLVVYEMLVGRRPFEADDPVPPAVGSMPTDARLAWMHLNREAPAINGLSPALQSWLSSLLGKDRAARPTDAREARAALRATPEMGWTPGGGLNSGRSTLTRLPAAPGRRRWLPVAVGIGIGVAGLAALFVFGHREPPSCAELLRSDPPGAAVMQDGARLGVTPLTVERICGTSRRVTLDLPSHQPVEVHLHGASPMDQGVFQLVQMFEPIAVPAPDAAVDAEVDAARRKPPPRRRRVRTPPVPPVAAPSGDEPESTGGLDF